MYIYIIICIYIYTSCLYTDASSVLFVIFVYRVYLLMYHIDDIYDGLVSFRSCWLSLLGEVPASER